MYNSIMKKYLNKNGINCATVLINGKTYFTGYDKTKPFTYNGQEVYPPIKRFENDYYFELIDDSYLSWVKI